MAEQTGVIRLKGKLAGITFYQRAGMDVARRSTGVEGRRIHNDPVFERTRENMSEFGASSLAGKALRLGLAGAGKVFGGQGYVPRIVSIMKAIISRGPGLRGQRSLEMLINSDLLIGFEFDKANVLAGVFCAPYTLTTNISRNEVLLTVPDFNTDAYINAPKGATHFRLVCAIASLSDYVYNDSTKQYEPVAAVHNSLGSVITSVEMSLGGMAGASITLNPQLANAPTLPATVALVVCLGIEFVQQLNGQFYMLKGANAMRVIQIS